MTAGDTPDTVIGTIELNRRDRLRVALSEFNGRRTVDVRKWFQPEDADAAMKPTPEGLTLAVDRLPALADLVNAAARARADGLLNDGAALK